MAVLKDGARIALVALALLAASSQIARAETTTLVCTNNDPLAHPLSPNIIELNEAQSSVTITLGAFRLNNGEAVPASSAVRYTAKFDQKTIAVETHDTFHRTYTINRLTGMVADDGTYPSGGTFHADWTCHVGKPQF